MTQSNPLSPRRSPSRRTLLGAAIAAPLGALAARSAWAQEFPSRPLQLVVPFPAGGSADSLSRIAAGALSKQIGQSVVVVNRDGAAGNIAAEYVARSAADGYTMLVAGQAILAINKPLFGKLGYDPETEFAYLSMLGTMPNVLIAHPQALPVRSVAELVERAKQRPGEVTYGSNGVGSLSHLTAEVLASSANIKLLHVPYRGAAPMMVDLLAGRIGFCFTGSALAVQLVKEGKVRALAVSTNKRLAQLPDVPTLVESGFPKLDAPTWFAAVAPSATPAPVLQKLRAAFAAVTASQAYREALEKQAIEAVQLKSQDSDSYLARERAIWAEAVRSSGATAQ